MALGYTIAPLTYVDALGFQEILDKRNVDEIRGILGLFRCETEPDKREAELHEVSSYNFSDLIVRATNLLGEHNGKVAPGILFDELSTLVYAQARLTQQGVLVRGGLTIGEVHLESAMLFGPALVRAYQLESQMALYPRIVVDPVVLRTLDETPALKLGLHDHQTERVYIRELIRKDADGIYFVDYLRAIAQEDSPAAYTRFREQHRDLILSRATAKESLDSTSVKISWSAHYHNFTVEDLPFDQSKKAGLKVSPKKLPMIYELKGGST